MEEAAALFDDAEWVALSPEDEKPLPDSSSSASSSSSSNAEAGAAAVIIDPERSQSLIFRRKKAVQDDEMVAFTAAAAAPTRNRKKQHLGKRKSEAASEEICKHEDKQKRKKAYIERRLRKDVVPISMISEDGSSVSCMRSYLHQPTSSCSSAKRPKLVRWNSSFSGLKKLKKAFVLFLCAMMLLVSMRQALRSGRMSFRWMEDQELLPAYSSSRFDSYEHAFGRASSKLGQGTSTTTDVTNRGSGSEDQVQHFNGEGKFFTTGKCTELFQYQQAAAAPDVLHRSSSELLKHGKARNVASKQQQQQKIKVTILPRKSAGDSNKSVFLVLSIDGLKCITYSCSLPQPLSP